VTSRLSSSVITSGETSVQTIGLANAQGIVGGITSFAITLSYDNILFNAAVTPGAGISVSDDFESYDDGEGSINILYYDLDGTLLAANGDIFTVTYSVKTGAAAGTGTVSAVKGISSYDFTDNAGPKDNIVIASYPQKPHTLSVSDIVTDYDTKGDFLVVPETATSIEDVLLAVDFEESTNTIKIFALDGITEIENTSVNLGTGMTISVYSVQNILLYSYVAVVKADTDGDGLTETIDMVQTAKYIVPGGSYTFSEAQVMAADIVGNSNGVNAEDIVGMRKIMLGIS